MHEKRHSIVNAITTPLGFFALALLITEGFLGIVLIFSNGPVGAAFYWAGMIIGALLFLGVVLIVWRLASKHPDNLTYSGREHLEKWRSTEYDEEPESLTEEDLDIEEYKL